MKAKKYSVLKRQLNKDKKLMSSIGLKLVANDAFLKRMVKALKARGFVVEASRPAPAKAE